jgi:hypothetical protein
VVKAALQQEPPMTTIKRLCLTSAAALGLLVSVAYAQAPGQATLVVNGVNLNPTGEGFYNANVGLTLRRGSNDLQVNFNISVQHVRGLEEVYARVRPEVEHLADELKNARDDFPPH